MIYSPQFFPTQNRSFKKCIGARGYSRRDEASLTKHKELLNPCEENGIAPTSQPAYRIGPFHFDPDQLLLFHDGRLIPLPPKALQLLRVLVENHGRLVDRERLMNTLWPDCFVEDANLSVHISQLRKALGQSSEPGYIETVPRRGYRFVGPVSRESEGGEDAASASMAASAAPEPISAGPLFAPLRLPLRARLRQDFRNWPRRAALATVLLLLFLVATATVLTTRARPGALSRDGGVSSDVSRLASSSRSSFLPDTGFASSNALRKSGTGSVAAYDAYLEGLHFLNERSPSALRTAIGYFEKAVTMDPNYALADAGIADCYVLLAMDPATDISRIRHHAEKAALRAVALRNRAAEVHTSLAAVEAVFEWQWAGAKREFQRAIKLDPDYAPARHWYAILYLAPRGRLDEAIVQMKLARQLDPASPIFATDLGWLYYCQHHYRSAANQLRQALALDVNFVPAHYRLSQLYLAQGREMKGISEIEADLRSAGKKDEERLLARVLATSGPAGLRGLYENQARRIWSQHRPGTASEVAASAIQAGDTTLAMQALRRAVAEHDPDSIYLKIDPSWNRLRSDPDFAGLLRQVGLPSR